MSMYLLYSLGFLLLLLGVGITLYLVTPRRYQSSETVANSYDEWTEDGILEFYWGGTYSPGSLWFAPKTERLSHCQVGLCT